MTDPETPLRSLHDKYCQLTGRNLRYTFYQNEWREWSRHFQESDLPMVFAWIEQENRKREKRYMIRTELLRIIGDVQTFEQLRAEAELAEKAKAANKRKWEPSAGEKALSEFRRTDLEPPPTEPRMSKDLLLSNLDQLKNEIRKQ